MSIDGCITGSSRQILVLTVWNVEVRLRVTVFLCQSEVDDVDLISTLPNSHQEIVWLDITMNERFGVNVLDTGNELIGEQKHCLEGEFAVAKVEEILQAGSEEVKYHGIIVTLGAEPTNKRDSHSSSQGLVDTSFILKLRVFGLHTFQFDSNFLAGNDVGA